MKNKKLHSCQECSHSFASETELKSHVKTEHEHLCVHCNYTFAGKHKLKSHMCRINVNNPVSEQFGFYTKDWFERAKCIRIFDNSTKEEVILLHSEVCIENNVCTKLPENFLKERYFKDTHGMIHLEASYFMESKSIKWMEILGLRIVLKGK